jgi:hypothetical protein
MADRWRDLLDLLDRLDPPSNLTAERPRPIAVERSQRARDGRKKAVGLLALATGITVAGLLAVVPWIRGVDGSRSSPTAGVGIGTIPPPEATPGDSLLAVAASGTNDVWAVGIRTTESNPAGLTLIKHWTGSAWRAVSCPNVGGLRSVTAPDRDVMWGLASNGLVRWNGTRCDRIEGPRIGGEVSLEAISATARNDVWVVGERSVARTGPDEAGWRTLVARWNGSGWKVFQTPNDQLGDDYLHSVVALSPTNVWAGGYTRKATGVTATLMIHWNGVSWRIARTPDPGRRYNAIWGVGSDTRHVWAVGQFGPIEHGSLVGLLLRRDVSWMAVAPPRGHRRFTGVGVSGVAANDAWAVGSGSNGTYTLIHFDGRSWEVSAGAPTVNTNRATLAGVVAVSSTDVWVVGTQSKPGGERPLIEHWDGRIWDQMATDGRAAAR